jgi:hypothetical protein
MNLRAQKMMKGRVEPFVVPTMAHATRQIEKIP